MYQAILQTMPFPLTLPSGQWIGSGRPSVKLLVKYVDRYVIVDEFASAQPQSAVSKSQKSLFNIHTIQQQVHLQDLSLPRATSGIHSRVRIPEIKLLGAKSTCILRITVEHSYSLATCSSTNTEPTQTQPVSTSQRQQELIHRHLPPWITSSADQPHASHDVRTQGLTRWCV